MNTKMKTAEVTIPRWVYEEFEKEAERTGIDIDTLMTICIVEQAEQLMRTYKD